MRYDVFELILGFPGIRILEIRESIQIRGIWVVSQILEFSYSEKKSIKIRGYMGVYYLPSVGYSFSAASTTHPSTRLLGNLMGSCIWIEFISEFENPKIWEFENPTTHFNWFRLRIWEFENPVKVTAINLPIYIKPKSSGQLYLKTIVDIFNFYRPNNVPDWDQSFDEKSLGIYKWQM